jgi:hypothetical protein
MIYMNIDLSDLEDILKVEEAANKEGKDALRALTAATHGKLIELANSKLHSRRQKYIESVSMFEEGEGVFVVNLDASARWIEDGISDLDMLEDLLKSKKVKRAKDGSSYLVVPFQHNKAKNQQTPAQQSLMSTIRSQMALEGASPAKLDMDEKGKPKLGLVKSMDITKAPTSTQALRIGRGPLGQVAQGATGGIPILKGIRVYQKEYKDRAGNTKVGRYIMTFRVASSKHRGTGKWQREHPLEGVNLMDEAMKWALEQWEQKIAPSILAKITAEIK